MKTVHLFAILMVLATTPSVQAGRRSFQGGCSGSSCSNGSCPTQNFQPAETSQATQPISCVDGQCPVPQERGTAARTAVPFCEGGRIREHVNGRGCRRCR